MNKIIVVGNGPSILATNAGLYIDAHKYVYRINEHYLVNTKITGHKITTWATAKDFHRHDIYKTGKKFTVDWSQNPTILYTGRPNTDRFELVQSQASIHNALLTLIPKEVIEKTNSKYQTNATRKERPSTGILVLAYLIEYIGETVDIIGFDGLQFGKIHYFGNIEKIQSKNHIHWPDREMLFLNEWRDNGKVNFYKSKT